MRKYTKLRNIGNIGNIENVPKEDVGAYYDKYKDNENDNEGYYIREMNNKDRYPRLKKGNDNKIAENDNEETYESDFKSNKILSFSHIRDLYPRFQYTDIAAHPAIVLLPYQVKSFFSIIRYLTLLLLLLLLL